MKFLIQIVTSETKLNEKTQTKFLEVESLTVWFCLNQSPVSMENSPAGGGKGTGILGRLAIFMLPNPPAALWKAREGK